MTPDHKLSAVKYYRCAALLLATFLSSVAATPPYPAYAEGPVTETRSRYLPADEPKQEVRVLRKLAATLTAAGKHREALKVLQKLEARTPGERELQIAIAHTEARLYMYDRAIARLVGVRELHPDWPRPRMELALVYEASGRLSEARAILVDELGRAPPPTVRRNLQARIRSIEDRMPFVGRFAFGVVPDSNITDGTHNDTVEFLGLPFQVNDDAKAKSGVHADVSFGGTLRTVWHDNTRLMVGIDLRHSQPLTKAGTPESDARIAFAAAARGRNWMLLTGIAAQPFVRDGSLDRREYSWFGTGSRHLAGPVGLGGSLVLTKGISAVNSGRDFQQWEAATGPRIAIGDSAVLQLAGIAGKRNAEADVFSYERRGGSAGITVVYDNGYRFSVSGAVIRDRYQRIPFGFDRVQKDVTTVAQARLVKGDLVIAGFSPSIGVGYNETRSTIDIYDKRGYSIELGLARPY